MPDGYTIYICSTDGCATTLGWVNEWGEEDVPRRCPSCPNGRMVKKDEQ